MMMMIQCCLFLKVIDFRLERFYKMDKLAEEKLLKTLERIAKALERLADVQENTPEQQSRRSHWNNALLP